MDPDYEHVQSFPMPPIYGAFNSKDYVAVSARSFNSYILLLLNGTFVRDFTFDYNYSNIILKY